MNFPAEKEIGDERLWIGKAYADVPAGIDEQYRAALMREYTKSEKTGA